MKILSLPLAAFLVSTFVVTQANSATIQPGKLQAIADNYLQQYRDVENISAVTLTVANSLEDSNTVFSGYTEFSGKQAVNASNLNQIGSITKSFISAIILQLEATPELHFSIDDKLATYLPEYSAWTGVTIRQLLNMTSGIPNYLTQDNYIQDLANNPYKYWLPEEEVSYVAKLPLLFTPGTQWNYSNTNYILAGMIISKLTGHSVEQEINKRFLAPNNSSHLNLKNTYYITHFYPSNLSSRMVHGYHFGGNIGKFIRLKADITNFSLSYAGAAGAIISNTHDMNQWVRCLLTPNKVLPTKQLKELTTLVSVATGKPLKIPNEKDPNGFGLGIGVSYAGPDIPGLIINYEGMTLGYRAQYLYIINQNLLIAVTVNSSTNEDNDHLGELLLSAYQALSK